MATQTQVYEAIRQWCRATGLRWKWIDQMSDAVLEDVQLMQQIRQHFFTVMTRSGQAQWNAIWGWCTKKQRPLTQKNLIKLEKAVQQAQSTRQHIKTHRHQVNQTGT